MAIKMKKQRKLFCELGPTAYKISVFKECRLKDLDDLLHRRRFAKKHRTENLPYIWKADTKLILRQLHGVDMRLQQNKATNLRLAAARIDGLILQPGEEFSFWNTVGSATARKGYLEGLVISNSEMKTGVGGGLCQMANLIHYLVLHTPLEVTELHHHSDALFPDSKRRVPFGTGASIFYKKFDYRFKNTSPRPVQLRVWVDDNNLLNGELRGTQPLKTKYRLTEEDSYYKQEADGLFYRNSKVYRLVLDEGTREVLKKELILVNHSKVMYDYDLIPREEIREA